MRDDKLYLVHISECITRITEYTAEGKEAFFRDTKTQDAVLRNLQIMAESTQRLSDPLKAAHPDIEWRRIAGFRNILVHDYLGINPVRVWKIIEDDLPALQRKIEIMLRETEPNANES